jgi:hypothetical protein
VRGDRWCRGVDAEEEVEAAMSLLDLHIRSGFLGLGPAMGGPRESRACLLVDSRYREGSLVGPFSLSVSRFRRRA